MIITLLLIFGPIISYTAVVALLGNMFEKAGIDRKKATTPFVNLLELFKLTEKNAFWSILYFVPYFNIILIIWLNTEVLKTFGYRGSGHQVLGLLFGYIYLPYISIKKSAGLKYEGISGGATKSQSREWFDALLFAVVAATIIRMFVFEAYTIPTASMENSLMIGDYLFVSKINYGPRIPNTPLAIPFTMQTLGKMKAYIDMPQLPYYRLPGFQKVKRNDIVVFNYPHDENDQGRKIPVDKRMNYVKRCVGIPGDTLQVIEGDLFINGLLAYYAPNAQFDFLVAVNLDIITKPMMSDVFGWEQINNVHSTNKQFSQESLLRNNGDNNGTMVSLASLNLLNDEEKGDLEQHLIFEQQTGYAINLYRVTASKLELDKGFETGLILAKGRIKTKPGAGYRPYPGDKNWSVDNYGPIVLPKKGETVTFTNQNANIYQDIIKNYEKRFIGEKKFKVNDSYTFNMDYYWMMGDNRHNSADSRAWGFVPEDHIVGKPWLIWMSIDGGQPKWYNKIRWNRLFSLVDNKAN